MNAALVRLFMVMAALYPGEQESALLQAIVGIEAGRIQQATGARVRWFAIVNEANRDGKVAALLRAALSDYPENSDLLAISEEIGVVPDETGWLRILAIWPEAPGQRPLDTSGDAAALYAVGLDYVALRGALATRDGVVREWGRVRPQILEIGAHGLAGEILLSDGATSVGWWLRLLRLHQPQLVLLLACDLADSGAFDIPSAFVRAGVADVIAVSDSILDTDAVLFAKVFFENMTQPMSVTAAYEIAKLVLTDAGAAMLQHRQGERNDA